MNSAAPAVHLDARTADRVAPAPADVRYGWVVRVMEADGPGILRLLYRLLSREADVLDAYQDCFCKLAALGDRPDVVSARAYAYRTATNIAIEMIRSRGRRAAHHEDIARVSAGRADDASNPSPSPEPAGLHEAIAQLPSHLRNVVVLRDLSGMPYEEVGRALRIDPATARVYRRHAVVKLAELLGAQEDLP